MGFHSCTDGQPQWLRAFNYTLPDSPLASTTVALMQLRPRVALVLSSGGPRGYAQIGVMRVLEEAGIEVDLVVGTSVVGVATALFTSRIQKQSASANFAG